MDERGSSSEYERLTSIITETKGSINEEGFVNGCGISNFSRTILLRASSLFLQNPFVYNNFFN